MKKLLFAASLFLTAAISAQETQERKRPERPTTEQMMKEFDNYNLSPAQKDKLQALYKEREAKFEKERPTHIDGERPEPPKDGERPQPPKEGQRPDDPSMKAKFEKDRKDFDKRVKKILTKEQFAKYQANQKEHLKQGPEKGGQRQEQK